MTDTPKEFIVEIKARFLAKDIDDALNVLGHHFLNPDDDAYQLLPGSEIDVQPVSEEEHA